MNLLPLIRPAPHKMETIATRIRAIARSRISNDGWTERRLARATHWSQSYLHKVLAGGSPMTIEIADSLIVALQIHASDLWTPDELAAWLGHSRSLGALGELAA